MLPHVFPSQNFKRIKRFTPADAALPERNEGGVKNGVEEKREHEGDVKCS